MKSSILICAYLAKDALVGWLSTPSGFLARFLLCTFLCSCYLMLNAFFLLAEKKIQKKIDSFGLGTVLIKTYEDGQGPRKPRLSRLFHSLGEIGSFVPFEHTFILGKLEDGRKCRIITFEENAMPGLLKIGDNFSRIRSPYFLVAPGFPDAQLVGIKIDDLIIEAEVFRPPKVLDAFSKDQPVLFVANEYVNGLGTFKRNQGFMFVAESTREMETLLHSIRIILDSLEFESYEISSPMDWIGEIESIQDYRIKAQTFTGILMGLLIISTFGSISIFEFRKNLFVISLFKSFGVKSVFLYLRYLGDGLVISSFSFCTANLMGRAFYGVLFEKAQLSVVGFENLMASNFQVFSNQTLWGILILSVLVSTLPISIALRKPIGKTLG